MIRAASASASAASAGSQKRSKEEAEMTETMTELSSSSSLTSHPQLIGTMRAGKKLTTPVRVTLGELTPNNVGTLRKLNQKLFPVAYSDKFYKDVLDPTITPEDYSKLVFYQDLCVGNIICRLEDLSAPSPTTISSSISPPQTPIASSSASAVASSSKSTSTSSTTVGVGVVDKKPKKLYIMTLGVLAPYRNQGLASKLLSHILTTASSSHSPLPPTPKPTKKPSSSKDKDSKDTKEKESEPVLPKPIIDLIYLHVQVNNEEARSFYEKRGFEVKEVVKDYFRKIEPRDAWRMELKVKKAE